MRLRGYLCLLNSCLLPVLYVCTLQLWHILCVTCSFAHIKIILKCIFFTLYLSLSLKTSVININYTYISCISCYTVLSVY